MKVCHWETEKAGANVRSICNFIINTSINVSQKTYKVTFQIIPVILYTSYMPYTPFILMSFMMIIIMGKV